MYFISTSARLVVPIRDRKVTYAQNGAEISVNRALIVEFSPAGEAVPEYAKTAVSRLARFGQGTGIDEDPFTRCGHIDTEAAALEHGWSDEERAEIERILDAKQGQSWVRADAPPAAKPWPAYDDISGDSFEAQKQIVDTLVLIGVSPHVVLQYELENQNRAEIVAVLRILVDEERAQAEEVVSA